MTLADSRGMRATPDFTGDTLDYYQFTYAESGVPVATAHRFDAGSLCLDLLATIGSRNTDTPIERLTDTGAVRSWLEGTGLRATGVSSPRVTKAWLDSLRDLREHVHAVVDAHVERAPISDQHVQAINEALVGTAPAAQLKRNRIGQPTVRQVQAPTLDNIRAAIAADLVEIVEGREDGHLHRCEADACDLVFADHSRGRPRRWCSGKTCGNRSRVAAHRKRAELIPD